MFNTISLHIPYPPSANRLTRSIGRGRVVTSREYNEWKRNAANALYVQLRNCAVFGAYQLQIKLTARRKRGDCDNRIKAVNDFLQAMGIVVNDKLCTRASVERADIGDHDCILVVTGEVAYPNQWELAEARAKEKAGRR